MRDFYTKENMQAETFHVPDGGLYFEPAELSFEAEADSGREGVIRVLHRDGRPARGYVYPSGRCMRGVREQFAPSADGTGYIRWQFDGRGIAPGRVLQGFFRVLSPCGEYRIPYTVRIRGKGAAAGADRAKAASGDGADSKAGFLALAGKDPVRAAAFFYSSRFEKILTDEKDRTLYRGLSMTEGNLQNVEEFLIAACGMEKTVYEPVEKELALQVAVQRGRAEGRMAGSRAQRALEAHRQRVRNSTMAQSTARTKISGAREEEASGAGNTPGSETEDLLYLPLHIRRTGTGFSDLVLQAEGSFLPTAPFRVPVKNMRAETDPDEQAQSVSVFTVRIPVNRAALHAGKNFGRLLLQGPFNDAEVPVEVHCTSSVAPVRRRQERELQLMELQLMRLYVDFRLTGMEEDPEKEDGQALQRGEWFRQADRIIDMLSTRSHGDLLPRLYGVHLLLLRGQRTEALRALGRIAVQYAGEDTEGNLSARFTGEGEEAYCYRQYLYARCCPEDGRLQGRVVRFLKGVYRAGGDWRTAWMLLDLAQDYAPGTAARWNFLRHQFENGCSSPMIWIEAWEMVRADPQILLPGSSVQERWARDDFGLHVLWYAARNNALTDRAAEVMAALAEKKKTFSGVLYRGLCAACGMERYAGGSQRVDAGTAETGDAPPQSSKIRKMLLRAVCILLVRGQDVSPQAHRWYDMAMGEGIAITRLAESWQQSMPSDDASFRLPSGRNAILRTTVPRVVRAVLLYDRFRTEESFPVKNGVAFLPVFGDANEIFLEDAEGNRYAQSLPYTLDLQKQVPGIIQGAAAAEGSASAKGSAEKRQSEDLHALAARIGFGDRAADDGYTCTPETVTAAGRLLDSRELTNTAHTRLLLECLTACGSQQNREWLRFFLKKADPAQGTDRSRAAILGWLEQAGEYERALRWLISYGPEGIDSALLGRICLGVPWEGGYLPTVVPLGWEAFLKENTGEELLKRLSSSFCGFSAELVRLRAACVNTGVPTADLDRRIIRQTLYTGAVTKEHAQIIADAGRDLQEAFLPAAAQYADFSFSGGVMMGERMTDLLTGVLADGQQEAEDICRIAFLKELSMRQGEISKRERAAAKAGLSVLLSKGIIFPFYRQFPGYDDRLDLYAEETLVQYHPAGETGGQIVFHYTTSRRGEAGNYRARPMKEMYRGFFVSGFLLFYGEQMHYYITDDAAQKHVVQSGMISQDARIADSSSGRFGLINRTTRAAALRDYDGALSLLSDYYRRSYLEEELFRR